MTELSSYKESFNIVYKIIDDIVQIVLDNIQFEQVCNWAIRHPVDQNNKRIDNSTEKIWGNSIINQVNNGQWTTKLCESFVYDLLKKLGNNPRRPRQIGRYRPDLETDNYIVEVKSRNWTTPGTAGEKVFGTPLKYAEIPELYDKPLMIVCVAYQEHEMTHGATPIFGDKVRPKTAEFLKFYELNQITFVPCSQLINQVNSL